ncbi:heat-inducible transcriptional repressor HrcA, partial [Actinophytocola sp.]|uniref:heat-inducible transcriptional repressor HrcA n=1 Tax=Actinophytocola sp. TaxID=1872138 RepID=UPI002D7E78F0
MVSSDERRFQVLRAIVADYVSSNEPVASKAIVDRHNLGVSSATVRNDMAALEEEGYITQPHTSAGRIPTDKGYRLFVDRLSDVKPLSSAERRAIQSFLGGALDLDDVLRRSVRLLAQLTRQVAVVQYPTLTRSTVRHLELVQLTPARVMLVLITDTGRVDQRMIDLGDVLGEETVGRLRTMLNATLTGHPLTDAAAKVGELLEEAPQDLRDVMTRMSTVLIESLVEHPEERLVL